MNAVHERESRLNVEELSPEDTFNALLAQAMDLRASDLYFGAQANHMAVQIRHLGIVRALASLPRELGDHCIGYIKATAGMNVVEHRRPIDGRWLHVNPDGTRIDLRVSVLPTLHGEDCAIRLVSRELCLLPLEELGMPRRELNELLAILNCPSGLVLVTGPTGSGKTTTLYACLNYLNNGERRINTIEDPIEYEIAGVRQSQINPAIGLGFPEMLRSVLRHAPDVIMIGEIRDPVTAATAVHAANSGHLVLATVHAPISTAAVQSLRAYGVHAHFLANSLVGVVAQRLVRTLCPECRSPFALRDAVLPFDEVAAWLAPGEGESLWAARGCTLCHQTGYSGRTGVFEVLRLTAPFRRLIAEGQPMARLREHAVQHGLIELRQAGLLKVAQGVTTAEELIRAVPSEFLGLED